MSAAVLGAGAAIGAAGSLMQGQAQATALDRAAQIQRQNAALDIQAGEQNAVLSTIHSNKQIGSITAAYGANGISADSGSALSVLAASVSGAELDRQNIMHGAKIRAINAENQAQMDEIGAQSAIRGSYLNAIAGVMTGGSKMFSNTQGVEPKYTPTTGHVDSGSDGGGIGELDEANVGEAGF